MNRTPRPPMIALALALWLLIGKGHGAAQGSPSRSAVASADGGSLPELGCNLPLAVGTPGRLQEEGSLRRSPTLVSVMPTRYLSLVHAVEGNSSIGIPLVSSVHGVLGLSGGLDDIGSYYLIPKLSAALRIPIASAIDLFYISLLTLGLLAGAWGYFILFHGWAARSIALVGLVVLTGAAYRIGDVYILFFLTTVMAVPWILALICRSTSFWLSAYLFLIGMVIGVANAVRSHAGTAALIFLCVMVGLGLSTPRPRKWLLFSCLAAGLLLPQVFFSRLVARRNAFLVAHCPEYGSLTAQHPLWHAVYSGLGFLENDYGLRWDDGLTYDKVQSIEPGTIYGSPEYERILRHQVFSLFRQNPWFVFITVASKFGVTLVVFLLSANVGLFAIFRFRRPWVVDSAFVPAIVFSSLFAIVAYPLPQYMLGLTVFGALYGVTSLGFALETGGSRRGGDTMASDRVLVKWGSGGASRSGGSNTGLNT